MKNLKKALSLVLASAMLFGMMVVGTGAAHSDVEAEHNTEAIAVVTAAGIMGANEEFNPDAKITRNEMAVVMVNMLGLDTDDFAGASQFTDVPAWAEAYVDACFANGIVSGVSATEYNGGANVTTAEAALMMLKALGYFQYAGDFENDWMLATVKQAAKIDLLDGIDATAKAAMTRNEVAQLALNALESKVVYASKSGTTTSITTDDVKIEVTGQATYYNENDNDNFDYDKTTAKDVTDLYLIEKLYEEDFLKQSLTTDLQQPGHKWVDTTKKLDEQKVVSVAKDAKYTIIVDKADLKDTLAVYNEYIDEDAKAGDVYADAKKTVFAKNGVVGKDGAYAIGDVVELYTNSDGKVTDVVVLDYAISKIEKIDTKTLTKAQKEDGATAKITIKGEAAVLDNNFAGFDYEKGDYVLYILSADKSKVLASELAESIEGKVSSIKSNKATIGGVAYPIEKAVTVGETGTFYLGKANEIMLTDTVASSDDYIYIYNLKLEEKLNAEGIKTSVATAYTVNDEGEKAVYDVALDIITKKETTGLKRAAGVYFTETTTKVTNGMSAVIAYSVNADGQLVKETEKDSISARAALTINKNVASGTTSATEFVFVNQTATAVKVSVATGYKNVNVAQNGYTVINADGDVVLAFVDGKNGSITSDAALAVVVDPAVSLGENDNEDPTYTYVVAIDGVESELTFKAAQKFTKGQVIAYEFDGDWAVIDGDASFYSDEVVTANDDYIEMKTGVNKQVQFNLTGDEIIYTIVLEYEDEAAFKAGKIDTATVAEGGEFEKADKVVFTVEDEAIETIFVYEYVY